MMARNLVGKGAAMTWAIICIAAIAAMLVFAGLVVLARIEDAASKSREEP